MKRLQLSVLLPLVLTLAACGHYSSDLASLEGRFPEQKTASAPHDIAPAAGAMAQGTLAQNLAREYYDLARYENTTAFDYKSSGIYTKKAKLAMAGKVAAPSRVEKYDIPAKYTGELIAARKTLIDALQTQNSPENAASLARAQSRFDCWVERAEEAVDETHFADCKAGYEAAIASLTMPAAGGFGAAGATYNIGFAANSTLIADMSRKDLDYVASLMSDPANAAYNLVLTGYKNAAVSGAYADKLTQERLAAAKAAIVGRGVQETRIATTLADVPAESGKVVVTVSPASGAVPASVTRKFVPVTPVTVSQ
ncbi:MAG: hypothetical protein DI626_01080 [Micavibrio aeruginosavorus]|uniref:OmpA-like domain-containing protein n=1 Tax=Micavibrio aeruginosavorus TaxID=349221 RepID=A0A2W5C095_9BACT|nr:MAG: hypothetical protein DI626_01080 [Micavibrio aeruginosavorus]